MSSPVDYVKQLGIDFQGDPPSSVYKMQKIVEHAGDSVLDIGCCAGAYVAFCQALGKRAIGIDVDSASLKLAQKQYPRCHFVFASGDELPFDDSEFETLLMWDVLEHIYDDDKAISEAIRVTNKNILMSVPKKDEISTSGNGVIYRHYVDSGHKRYYTPESIRKVVENAGAHIWEIDHWCRIYPLLLYRYLGIPRWLTFGLDSLFWLFGRNKKAFLRNLFVEIKVKNNYRGGRID